MVTDERIMARLVELVDAASRVFTRHGYRRAKMADIARELGVAPGTLYLYVQGKEALFNLVIRWQLLGPDEVPPVELPVATAPEETTLALLHERLQEALRLPSLVEALKVSSPADVERELRDVVGKFFDLALRHRRLILLIEACAQDWPEMAALFYDQFRSGFLERLTSYLQRRMEAGLIEPVPDAAVAARTVVETVAWWAIHRFGDWDPMHHLEDAVRPTVVAMLVRALRGNVGETAP